MFEKISMKNPFGQVIQIQAHLPNRWPGYFFRTKYHTKGCEGCHVFVSKEESQLAFRKLRKIESNAPLLKKRGLLESSEGVQGICTYSLDHPKVLVTRTAGPRKCEFKEEVDSLFAEIEQLDPETQSGITRVWVPKDRVRIFHKGSVASVEALGYRFPAELIRYKSSDRFHPAYNYVTVKLPNGWKVLVHWS